MTEAFIRIMGAEFHTQKKFTKFKNKCSEIWIKIKMVEKRNVFVSSLSGRQAQRFYETDFQKELSQLGNSPNIFSILKLIEEFQEIHSMIHTIQFWTHKNIQKFKEYLDTFKKSWVKLQPKTFPVYLHNLIFHLIPKINQFGCLIGFGTEGLERENKIMKRIFWKNTNRQGKRNEKLSSLFSCLVVYQVRRDYRNEFQQD